MLLALCSSLLQKSIKGGFVVTGGLNLGGSIETIFNPVAVVEIAIEKGAPSILMPISSRRQFERPARRPGSQDHHPLLPRCPRRVAEGLGDLMAAGPETVGE